MKRVFVLGLLVLCAHLLVASLAFAEEAPKAAAIEGMLVTAAGGEEFNQVWGESVVTDEILERPTIGDSILESLRQQAGVQIMGTALAGNKQGEMRLRGFDEKRFRVLVDGLPIQRDGSYGNGPVDWSVFSPEMIERVEIHRGAAPARYGNTLGGVVNLVTRPPSDKPELRAGVNYGSLDTLNAYVTHRWKKGPLGWSLGGSQYLSDGYLRNMSCDRQNFTGELSLDLPLGFTIKGGVIHSRGKTGLGVYNRPDSPYYDSGYPRSDELELGGPQISARLKAGALAWGKESELKDENTILKAEVIKNFTGGRARLRGLTWNQKTTENYYDAQNSSKKIYERETKPEDGNWALMGDVRYKLGDHSLEIGGETRRYGWGGQTVPYIDTSYFTGAISYFKFIAEGFKGQTDNMSYHALYAQDLWRLSDKLSLNAGLRAEWWEAKEIDPGAFGFPASAAATSLSKNNLDPRLGLRWDAWQGGVIGLKLARAHRYPDSPEYFWWYLNKGSGFFNTDFKEEKAWQYEIGLEQALGENIIMAFRGYYNQVDDYISSTMVPGVGTVVYNIDEVEIKGLEVEAKLRLPANLTLWGNLTLQEADKSGDPWDRKNQVSSQLANFPERMFNLGLDYNHGEIIKAGLSLQYVDSREYMKGATTQELSSILLLNAHASYRFLKTAWGAWDLVASAQNMLDREYGQKDGYPMPGFTVIGGVRYVF